MKKFVAQNTVEEIASLRRFPGRPENIISVVKIEVYGLLESRATRTQGVCAVFGSKDNDAYCGCAISARFQVSPTSEFQLIATRIPKLLQNIEMTRNFKAAYLRIPRLDSLCPISRDFSNLLPFPHNVELPC